MNESGVEFVAEPILFVVAAALSSDAGLLPFRQFDEQIGFTQAFAAVLDDPRDPSKSDHTFEEMTRARIYGILAGYEDQYDHDILRTTSNTSICRW